MCGFARISDQTHYRDSTCWWIVNLGRRAGRSSHQSPPTTEPITHTLASRAVRKLIVVQKQPIVQNNWYMIWNRYINIYNFILNILFLDNTVGLATRLWAGRPGFISRQQQEAFLSFIASRPALGLTQPPHPVHTGIKRPGCEADHLPPSNTEARNGETIPPLLHMP
jgi:hypothetical protein